VERLFRLNEYNSLHRPQNKIIIYTCTEIGFLARYSNNSSSLFSKCVSEWLYGPD